MNEDDLCTELGISAKRRLKLVREHGDIMPFLLELKAWKKKQDDPRIPARQDGQRHPPQYVDFSARAVTIDEPESVPEMYQNVLSMQSRTRRAEESERAKADQEKQLRSFTQAMRDKIKQGEDITPHLLQARGTYAA